MKLCVLPDQLKGESTRYTVVLAVWDGTFGSLDIQSSKA